MPGLRGNGVNFWIFSKGHEGAGCAIKSMNATTPNVIDPAVQSYPAFFKRQANGWVSLDISQLSDDVFAHHSCDFGWLIRMRSGFVHDSGRVSI
ncbi:hypothetical protein BM451_20295 [Dickeya dadantii]|nr:hypothetical protein BM451_20295 [Dickeya dadantii]